MEKQVGDPPKDFQKIVIALQYWPLILIMLQQGVSLLKTNTNVRCNLFIAGQYTTKGYGTITGSEDVSSHKH